MTKTDIVGVAPQNADGGAAGVSLSRTERFFLECLTDPMRDNKKLVQVGCTVKLRPMDVEFITEWINNHGAMWAICEITDMTPRQITAIFRNPQVRKIINAAADLGICLHTGAGKEEIVDYHSQTMRDDSNPKAIRQKASEEISKLQGFYNDKRGEGGMSVNIAILPAYPQEMGDAADIDPVEVVNS